MTDIIESLRRQVHRLECRVKNLKDIDSLATARHKVEIKRLEAIVDKLPKDAEGNPVEEGETYYLNVGISKPCIGWVDAGMAGFDEDYYSPKERDWSKAYRTEEAALAARNPKTPT